jgi:hypothetical protein
MRELIVHVVAATALQDGASVIVNDHDSPAASVLFGDKISDPSGSTVRSRGVVTPQPVGGAEILIERRATDVDPKATGAFIVQVTVPCCMRTIDKDDPGLHDIVTLPRSAGGNARRAPMVVDPDLQFPFPSS